MLAQKSLIENILCTIDTVIGFETKEYTIERY